MDIGEIPLFAMLRQRLGYLGQRQQLIAQNVANADTPGFRPLDLKPFSFQGVLEGQSQGAGGTLPLGGSAGALPLAQTAGGQLAGIAPRKGTGPYRSSVADDTETTLDGNSVNLEDQMIKLSDARMQYDAAIQFYQKSLDLLRMAARRPGG